MLLRQLGLHLAESGRFQQVLKLYQQAQKDLHDQPRSAAYIMLSMELGRLCFVTDHPQEAAAAFAEVLPAIDEPADFGLNEKQKKMFSGEEGTKALELFAEAFLAADRPDDALAAYERLDRLRPDKPMHFFHLARVVSRKKELAKALEQLQSVLRRARRGGEAGALYAPGNSAYGPRTTGQDRRTARSHRHG